MHIEQYFVIPEKERVKKSGGSHRDRRIAEVPEL